MTINVKDIKPGDVLVLAPVVVESVILNYDSSTIPHRISFEKGSAFWFRDDGKNSSLQITKIIPAPDPVAELRERCQLLVAHSAKTQGELKWEKWAQDILAHIEKEKSE